jgi:hypothetical protein
VALRCAHATRQGDPVANFDVRIERVDVDVEIWSLLSSERRLESLSMRGVRGRYDRDGRAKPIQASSPFRIDRLSIEDAAVQWTVRRDVPVSAELRLASLESNPLRSDRPVFDILFRTNAVGTLDTLEGARSSAAAGGRLPGAAV